MPKVTVLVPAYNNEAYLAECLDSILAQTLEDLEIICLNDGSTDSTLDIMREYEAKDGRITVVDKPNSGYGDTLNRGLDIARGEYVTTLESDDIFPQTACQDMYEFAVANNLDFCKADAEEFLGDGDDRTFYPNPATTNAECYESVFDPSSDPGRWQGRAGQPGMYSVAFLNKYGIRHNTTPGASFQDTGFWAQVMFCGSRVRYIAKPCYFIRRDNPGSSELNPTKVFTICTEFEFINEKAKHMDGVDHKKCLTGTAYFAFVCYRWNCTRFKGAVLRSFIERFASEMRAYEDEGALDFSYFKEDEAKECRKLLADPAAYYYEDWVLPEETCKAVDGLIKENAALKQELEEVYASKRYRIGTVLTAPGRLVRRGN